MKNSRKGFIIPLLIIAITLLAIGVGVYEYHKGKTSAPTPTQTTTIATAPVSNQKDILAILVSFQDSKPNASSDTYASVKAKLDAVSAFYIENDLTGAFKGFTYDITPGYVSTDFHQGTTINVKLFNAAVQDVEKQAQKKYGFNPLNYKYIYFITPKEVNCGGILGYCVPSTPLGFDDTGTYSNQALHAIFINGPQPTLVYAHELGHALPQGLHHFGSLTCGKKDIDILKNCSGTNYSYTVMGNLGLTHLSAYQKERMGYIIPAMEQTVLKDGIYTLTPIETRAEGLKDLAVQSPSGGLYYVEYRTLSGFDTDFDQQTWITEPYTGLAFDANGKATKNDSANAPEALFLKNLIDNGDIFTDDLDPIDILKITEMASNPTTDTVSVTFNKMTISATTTNQEANPVPKVSVVLTDTSSKPSVTYTGTTDSNGNVLFKDLAMLKFKDTFTLKALTPDSTKYKDSDPVIVTTNEDTDDYSATLKLKRCGEQHASNI